MSVARHGPMRVVLAFLVWSAWSAATAAAQDAVPPPPQPAPQPAPPPETQPPTVLTYQPVPPPPPAVQVVSPPPAPVGGASPDAMYYEEDSIWTERPFVLEAQLSPIGGPYGIAAAAIDVSVVEVLSINAGLGIGGVGPQYGASIRPRFPIGHMFGIGVTVGVSRGLYQEIRFHGGGGETLSTWLNLGPAFELRPESGFSLRVNLGISYLLHANEPDKINGDILPYGTVAVGFAP